MFTLLVYLRYNITVTYNSFIQYNRRLYEYQPEYYKIFYYVAKFGGITQAADKLFVSQPAVSRAVKLLETGSEHLFLSGTQHALN